MLKRRRAPLVRERGSVAITVALTMLTLIMIAGVAVDLSRIVYVRNKMQSAMDGAMTAAAASALGESAGANPDTAAMENVARQYFNANSLPNGDLVNIAANGFKPQYRNDATYDDSMVATLDFSVPMTFARFLGVNSMPMQLTSVAKRPRPSPVEMVIALDTTTSMGQAFGSTTKLTALKASAKQLVTTLMKGDYVKVGLVPFAGLIRIDPNGGYFDHTTLTSLAPWLAFDPKPVINDCVQSTSTNCKPATGTCYDDGVPYTCTYTSCTTVCTKWQVRTNFWSGCIYFRPPPGLTTIANPTAPRYYGVWSSFTCSGYNMATDLVTKVRGSKAAENLLKSKIDSLNLIGGLTYIPAALIWSWNMLTTETTTPMGSVIDTKYPLNSGYTAAEVEQLGVRKALVLITDGNNSGFAAYASPNYYNTGTIQNIAYTPAQQAAFLAQTNADMVTICNRIKNAGISIYVIALQLTAADLAYKSLLRDQCSSGPDYFFDTSNPTQLDAAFSKIGKSFSYNSITQ